MRYLCHIAVFIFLWQCVGMTFAYAENVDNVLSDDAPNNWSLSNIDPAYIGLLGVFLGGLLGLLTPLISNILSARIDIKKWDLDQTSEKNKWLRERMLEIYSNCLESLSSRPFDHSKASKWLELLLVYFPNRNSEDYYQFFNLTANVITGTENEEDIKYLHEFTLELAATDPRLHDNKNGANFSGIYWHVKGLIFCKGGKFSDALKAFDESIKLYPDYILNYYNKGLIFYRLKEYDQALNCYESAINHCDTFREAWEGKSKALEALGRLKEAKDALDNARIMEPYSKM